MPEKIIVPSGEWWFAPRAGLTARLRIDAGENAWSIAVFREGACGAGTDQRPGIDRSGTIDDWHWYPLAIMAGAVPFPD